MTGRPFFEVSAQGLGEGFTDIRLSRSGIQKNAGWELMIRLGRDHQSHGWQVARRTGRVHDRRRERAGRVSTFLSGLFRLAYRRMGLGAKSLMMVATALFAFSAAVMAPRTIFETTEASVMFS